MSLGSLVCLLEIRAYDGSRPAIGRVLLRTIPIYALAVCTITPHGVLSAPLDLIRLSFLLILLFAAAVSACIAFFTNRSLLDRISKTEVLQLKLPHGEMPRVLGFRIM